MNNNYVSVRPSAVTPEVEQSHYEEFFEDVFIECEDKVMLVMSFLSCISLSSILHSLPCPLFLLSATLPLDLPFLLFIVWPRRKNECM